jgi:Predicted ATPase of the PP-loop superfamily implicated in cell cycle control
MAELASKDFPDFLRRSLVPLSGGKDSIYVLYYMVKKLGLKSLAIHFDNRVQTQIAHSNIKKATDIFRR